jgi:hypothetical protein
VEVETDRDRSFGGRKGRLPRLPGELDEVQEAVRAFGALPGGVKALTGALTAATAALGTAGGLAGAATALATRFGDLELRRDLQKLKQRFRSLGATFAEAFEPIIRGTVIPAGVALAEELRSVIPELKAFVDNNLPTLVGAVQGLVQAILNTAKAFGLVSRTLGILTSGVQLLVSAFGAQQGYGDGLIQENVQKEFIDILQGFGFGGKSIGFEGASLEVPQTQVQTIVERIQSGKTSIANEGDAPLTEDLRKIQRQVRVARAKFERLDSFTRKDLQKTLTQLRQKGVDALLAVEDRTGEAQDRTSTWIQKLEKAQAKLQAIKDQKALQAFRKATAQPADATAVEPAEPTNRFPNKRFEGRPLPEGMNVGLSALKEAKKGADSVSDINSLIKATREAFNTLNNKEARNFIGRLQRMRSKMQGLADATERLGQRTKQALAEGLLRIGDAFGRSIANAIANLDLIDGGLSRIQKIKKKLSTLQLQQRQRRLREQLGEATGIDAQVIRKQLSLVSAQLKKARKEASWFGKAFQTLKGIIGNVAKAIIQQLTALIAKLARARRPAWVVFYGSGFCRWWFGWGHGRPFARGRAADRRRENRDQRRDHEPGGADHRRDAHGRR